MKRLKLALLLSLVTLSLFTFSQKNKYKFGKITKSDFKIPAEIDSSASAVILYEAGKLSYDGTGQFHKVLEVTRKILILNKEGLDWANYELNLYKYGTSTTQKEHVSKLKAAVYNLENNEVIKTKVKKSEAINEEYNSKWNVFKLSFPNVKVGSVIEYKITTNSPAYYYIDDWYFQHSIPVVWSQFRIIVPEFFYFKRNTRGYLQFENTSVTESNKSLMFNSGIATTAMQIYYYSMKNIPAFENESYIDSRKNYLASVQHELNSIQFPGQKTVVYTKSWKQVTLSLLKSSYFGKRIKSNKAIKGVAEKIKSTHKTKQQQVRAAHKWVSSNVKWNKYNSIYINSSLKKIITEKKGNSAEVNAVFIQLLRDLNITANPVVLSTRSNGQLIPWKITTDALNYVVAKVEIDSTTYYTDATSKNCPVGLLPIRTQNGKGRLIANQWRWEDLDTKKISNEATMVQLTLGDDGNFTGKSRHSNTNYEAYVVRNELETLSEEEYIENIEKANSGLEIGQFEIKNKDNIYKKLSLSMDFVLKNKAEITGDLISFSPMAFEQVTENPFLHEKREYPVDFAYPKLDSDMIMIDIPKGYVIESTPKSVNIQLPDGAGSFIYVVQTQNNKIVVNSRLKLNKKRYSVDEYPLLKQLFGLLINKHAEPIVLKKQVQ